MEAIVLAGGFGTRLASRLKDVPKPMAAVAGRPFLEILLGHLSRHGCRRVVLSVGYLHEGIERHFGASFAGMELAYAVEPEPLGTGGAIRAALGRIEEPAALVLNGDTFLDAPLGALLAAHASAGASFSMAVTQQPDVSRYGGVVVEREPETGLDRVAGFVEKGRHGAGQINAGVYAIQRALEWPERLGASFSFERDFLMVELERLKPLAFAVNGFFLDIGVPEDLDRAQVELAGY